MGSAVVIEWMNSLDAKERIVEQEVQEVQEKQEEQELQEAQEKQELQGGRAWVEINLSALANNVRFLQSRLPKTCKLMPAVKANAYGHGAGIIAKELNRLGIHDFCVATVLEGVELRRQGIVGQILILGYTHPEQFHLLHQYQLTQSVIDVTYGKTLNQYGKHLNVHIIIDSGMHRLGERVEHIDEIASLFQLKYLCVTGMYSHLCASDGKGEKEIQYTKSQIKQFDHMIGQLKERGITVPKLHMLASYGVLHYPEYCGDYARVGIAMYGVLSTKEDSKEFEGKLEPVLTIKARIASLRMLAEGETAGYGMAYEAKSERVIAAITIGYADGIPRELSGGNGSVLVHGKEVPIIGRVCMDQMLIDITDVAYVQTGDEVVIIGKSGEKEITVYDIAKKTGTISNEILSRLGGRLERKAVRR